MNQPPRDSSPRAGAAQTASIGDQDMMTFLFNDNPTSLNNNMLAVPGAAGMPAARQTSCGNTLDMNAPLATTPAGVPDPLLRFFTRGESLMADEEAFDTASLDALLNSVRTSPQEQEGEVSDLTATDALSSLGELSRAHAQAQEQHGRGHHHHHHHHHRNQQESNNGMFSLAQPQGAPDYLGQGMVELPNNNIFQPSQPISVSTGAVFSVPQLMALDYGNVANGGALMMGFPNEGMAQQQHQLPYAMMPQQQQGLSVASLSNSLMPHQVAQLPQSTAVAFQAPNFAQHQQPQLMSQGAPWAPSNINVATGQLKNPAISPTASSNTKANKRKKPTPSTSTTSSFYPPISEDESDRKKRRSQRNLREQERSHQITARITELRNLLAEAGVHFKPDRYSTLVGVVSYIKMLQGRTKALDEEHRKLIDTISGANRLANAGGTTTVQSHNKLLGESATQSSSSDSNTDEEFLIFLQGIDYKFIFKSCGVALAITSVDGRFVDCNEEFLRVTEYSRDELLGGDKITETAANTSSTSGETGATSPTIGGLVTVYTTTSANTSEMTAAAAAGSKASKSPTPEQHPSSRPPTEVRMRKKPHLSLFNLLGREDMENVYAAMSRMLKAPNSESNYVSSSSRDASNSSSEQASGKDSSAKESSSKEYSVSSSGRGDSSSMPRSSSSDSLLGSTTSSSGNEVSGDGISRYTVDHWSGKVKHTRRKEQFVSKIICSTLSSNLHSLC
jgi:PAS domain-containing protein